MELDAGIKRHYCFYGEIYDPMSREGKRRINLLADLVEEYLEPSGGLVLDVGCGMGVSSAALIAGGYEKVVGIDIQEEYITKARKFAQESGLPAEFRLMDIRKLEFPAESFDAVAMLSNPLPHWDMNEMERILSECHRVLRPGGWIMIHYLDWIGLLYQGYKDVLVEETESGFLISYHTELNTLEGFVRRLYLGPSEPRGFQAKFRLWSPWLLHYLMEKAGFSTLETEYIVGSRIAITTGEKVR
ncbi:MAG: class I SAM-dependent methyltransferase [candidate division WOR-3 bacterium]